jgi:VWFA-related protein
LRKALFILLVSVMCQALFFQQEEESAEGRVAAVQPKYQVQAYSTLHEVRVVDGDGHLVKGLTEDRFLVLESGKSRPIQYFEEMDASPLSLGILIDIGSSSDEKQILVAKAAAFELVHQLEPIDEVLIGVYDEDIHFLSDLTNERVELLRGIENVSPGGRISFFSKLAHAFASSAHTGWAVDKTLMRMKNCSHSNKIRLRVRRSLVDQEELYSKVRRSWRGLNHFAIPSSPSI